MTSRGSSVSIVSDYGLDDRAIGVRSPAEAKDFPLTSISRPALRPTQPPVQSAFHEKVPAVGVGSGAVRGGKCTGGRTKVLLLVEISMTHQGVTLLHTD
jgi:hypothetical protein